MGFSVSGAAAIIMLGLLVAFAIAYPTALGGVERVNEAQDQQADRALAIANGDLTLWNASYNASSDTLEVHVNNTGSTTFAMNHTDLLVDGSYATNATRSIDGQADTAVWLPGETLIVTIREMTSPPDRIKLVTEYGLAVSGAVTEVN